jgi:hypothetical protein
MSRQAHLEPTRSSLAPRWARPQMHRRRLAAGDRLRAQRPATASAQAVNDATPADAAAGVADGRLVHSSVHSPDGAPVGLARTLRDSATRSVGLLHEIPLLDRRAR